LSSEEKILVPLATSRANVRAATQFRSTWLSSSLLALKERELLDQYFRHLAPEHRSAVESAVAGVWLPAEVADAHYAACDRLLLPASEQFAIGLEVTKKVHGSALSTAVRLAKGAGVTPWTALAQVQRLWERIWVGGAVTVTEVGPKDARLEILGWTCSRYPYCKTAMRGVLTGTLDLFCQRTFVSPIEPLCTSMTLGYRIAWA
jgi:hypothetical protein